MQLRVNGEICVMTVDDGRKQSLIQKIKPMKNIVYLFLILFSVQAFSQIHDPVKWKTSVNKISDTEYELVATATIQDQWHLYSQNVPKDGPVPTSFIFEGSSDYMKRGNTSEGVGHEIDDKIFGMRIKYFDNKADFKQRIRIKNKKAFKVNAVVEFMVCNDTQCLPPKEVDLVFDVK